MIVCHRCGKENQDHYKFCLGCGAELNSASEADDVGTASTVLAGADHAPAPGILSIQPGGTQSGHPGPGSTGAQVSPPPAGPTPAGPPPGVPAGASGSRIPAGEPASQPWHSPNPVSLPGVGPRPEPAPSAGLVSVRAASEPGVVALATNPAPAAGPRMCPSCQSEIPPAFKFCGVCGFKMPEIAQPPLAPATPVPVATAVMTLIRPDGSEGGTHELREGENKIGRNHGVIFENDGYLSPSHALLTVDSASGTAVIRDLGSLNGIFVRMTAEEDITPGQIIRIGQELLRFDTIDPPQPLDDGTEVMGSPNPGYWGKITVVIGKDIDGSSYPLLGQSVTLGRERGEINFPDDGYVSGLHARLSTHDGRVVLADLGSSNGTFIKVYETRTLTSGSFVLLGQQLFRLSLPEPAS